MGKLGRVVLIAGLILVVVFGVQSCTRYNRIVAADEEVKTAWAQVQTVLKRRADLIPNLVATVKGFAAQEKEVLVAVTEARAKVGGAGTIAQQVEANTALSSALGRLMVVVERYPELKSNQNFLQLQDELAGAENRIAVERRRYNLAVKSYNLEIRRFPGNIYASLFGFGPATPFEAPESDQEPPKVDFKGAKG